MIELHFPNYSIFMTIEKFDSTQFYRKFTTRYSCWEGASETWDIEFLRNGRAVELLSSYYKAKYDTNIIIKPMTYCENNTADIGEYLREARARANGQEEYREALFIKFFGPPCYENGHAIPIIYIKTCDKEALFLANSLGIGVNDHNWIFKRHDLIKIYVIKDAREKSNTGCYIDAFVFLNDAIGKENGFYRIPCLLSSLEKHSVDGQGTTYKEVTKLHPRLLKTFQSSELVGRYSSPEYSNIVVNKRGETIEKHFERYRKTSKSIDARPAYIAQKGMKLRGTVEIEFYLQRLTGITVEQRHSFIEGAKKITKVTHTS